MGKIQSAFGPIKGKIQNLRFSVVAGDNIVASQPSSYNDAKTTVQVQNRTKLRTIASLLGAMLIAVRVGFKNSAPAGRAYSKAVGVNLKKFVANATLGAPQLMNLELSQGDLMGETLSNEGFVSASGEVRVDFTDSSNGVNAFPTDIPYIAACDIVTGKGGAMQAGTDRTGGNIQVNFPQLIGSIPANVYAWIFFYSPTTGEVSNSQQIFI